MKIGDRVKIAPNTQYYFQAPDVPGTVIDAGERYLKGWVEVRWDESPLAIRDADGYPIAELIILQYEFPKDYFSEEDIDKAVKFIGTE